MNTKAKVGDLIQILEVPTWDRNYKYRARTESDSLYYLKGNICEVIKVAGDQRVWVKVGKVQGHAIALPEEYYEPVFTK